VRAWHEVDAGGAAVQCTSGLAGLAKGKHRSCADATSTQSSTNVERARKNFLNPSSLPRMLLQLHHRPVNDEESLARTTRTCVPVPRASTSSLLSTPPSSGSTVRGPPLLLGAIAHARALYVGDVRLQQAVPCSRGSRRPHTSFSNSYVPATHGWHGDKHADLSICFSVFVVPFARLGSRMREDQTVLAVASGTP
jgi:hypothetical protein